MTNSKGQGQGHAHVDDEYRENGDIYGKNYYHHQIASWLAYEHLIMALSKGHSQGHARFDNKSLGNGDR